MWSNQTENHTHILTTSHTYTLDIAALPLYRETCQSVGEMDLTTLNWLIIEQNKLSAAQILHIKTPEMKRNRC